jgi:CheY-like chemotaxis protein
MPLRGAKKLTGEGRKILVVDDDLAIRVLLQAVLQRMEFTVELAEDGQDAIEKLQDHQVDLVLLDLMMPRLNGYEFLERVQTLERGRPHIIVFTAAGQRGIDKIPPGRICNSILKPFDLETFLVLMNECLEGESAHGVG